MKLLVALVLAFFCLALVSGDQFQAPKVTVTLVTYNPDPATQTTTFCYNTIVDGPSAISHFDICLYSDWDNSHNGVVSYVAPVGCAEKVDIVEDPSIPEILYGIKFDCNPGGDDWSGTFCITLRGLVPLGDSQTVVKAARTATFVNVQGPAGCGLPYVDFCDDRDACTADSFDVVDGKAVCVHRNVCGGCSSNAECDDGDVCTDDVCSNRVCHHNNNVAPCNDGIACTTGDVCSAGVCAGTPVVCNDNNECTDDSCDINTGSCVFSNNVAPCDDHLACTVNDVCGAGVCAGTPVVCNDNNECTDDSCNPETGSCVFDNNVDPCDDHLKCTVDDVCGAGVCAGTPVVCDDGNVCTDDSCNPDTGSCVFDNNVDPCDDHVKCTVDDVCGAGVCAGTPVVCDDGNVCTDDFCYEVTGACAISYNTDPCDDHVKCTVADTCGAGVCAGTPVVCNDGNVCTDDFCNENNGQCDITYNTNPCDDGQLCTLSDTCASGSCVGTPKVCSDNNFCTGDASGKDSCFPEDGLCHFINNANPCDDGDSCTKQDVCANGQCHGVDVCPNPAINGMPVYAGQWYQSASLTVFAAGEYLVVQWVAQPGWSSNVFHIYAGTSAPGSAPGSYPFIYTLPTPVTSASFKIRLRDVFPAATCDSSFFFAFHTETINDGTAACVAGKGCPGTTETSWWNAANKFKTGWGSYGTIQLCCCYKSKTDSVFSVSATLTKKIKSVVPETGADVLARASQQALTENQIQQAFAKLLAGVIPADNIYVLELTQLNKKGDVSVVLGFSDTDSVTAFTATRILMNLSDADYAAVGLENVRVSDLPEDQRTAYNQQVKVLAQAADYSSNNSPSSGASSLQICWMAMMLLLVNLWM